MKRVRTQFEASLLMSKESTNSRSQRLGSDILSYNRLISDQEILEKISAVKKSDITKLAQKIFFSSKPTFAAIGCVKEIMEYEKITKKLKTM